MSSDIIRPMLMTRPTAFLLALMFISIAISGCTGGTIRARVTLPYHSENLEDSYSGAPYTTPGVVVDAGDGTDVCQRLKVYLYQSDTAPDDAQVVPQDQAPRVQGGTIAKYDPSQRTCEVIATNLDPASNWWLVVDYPVTSSANSGVVYYRLGESQAGSAVSGGSYPITVTDKQTTNLDIELRATNHPDRVITVPTLNMTGINE